MFFETFFLFNAAFLIGIQMIWILPAKNKLKVTFLLVLKVYINIIYILFIKYYSFIGGITLGVSILFSFYGYSVANILVLVILILLSTSGILSRYFQIGAKDNKKNSFFIILEGSYTRS
jgi:hypothetical protein